MTELNTGGCDCVRPTASQITATFGTTIFYNGSNNFTMVEMSPSVTDKKPRSWWLGSTHYLIGAPPDRPETTWLLHSPHSATSGPFWTRLEDPNSFDCRPGKYGWVIQPHRKGDVVSKIVEPAQPPPSPPVLSVTVGEAKVDEAKTPAAIAVVPEKDAKSISEKFRDLEEKKKNGLAKSHLPTSEDVAKAKEAKKEFEQSRKRKLEGEKEIRTRTDAVKRKIDETRETRDKIVTALKQARIHVSVKGKGNVSVTGLKL